jgi:hypothetical protein
LKVASLYDGDNGQIVAVIHNGLGGTCAATPAGEPGTRLPPLPASVDVTTETVQTRIFARGTFRLCVWLLDASGGVVAQGSDALTVRAARGDGGFYVGRTAQHFALSLAVFRDGVIDFTTRARYRCSRNGHSTGSIVQPLSVPDGIYVQDAPVGGAFGNGSSEINYRFKFRHGQVAGTLRERYISAGANLCDSGVLHFSARRR